MKSERKGNILILTGSYGVGHLQAANAIQQAMRLLQPAKETIVVDFMEWIHPVIDSVSRYVFSKTVKNFPSVYGYVFEKTRTSTFSSVPQIVNVLGIRRLLKLLKEVEPEVVVSTFPFAAAAMSLLKSYQYTNVPTVTVITDHTNHGFWIYENTDQYIVGSQGVQQALLEMGIPNSRISVTGIPIRFEFVKSYNRKSLQGKYGLDTSLPTLLVMGGGYGMIAEDLSDLIALDSIPETFQIIFVCGQNHKLKQRLKQKLIDSKHKILVTGYVDYIHELMCVSDLLITKPGGLTTSEAIAMELPMLIYQPLLGQEQDNAEFLLNAGVAIQADNRTDLQSKLIHTFSDSNLLMGMKEKEKKLQTKWAAFDASEIILETREAKNVQMA